MKKLIIAALFLMFPVVGLAAVTDGITLTGCDQKGDIATCTIAWANDTGTDIGPTAITVPRGYLLHMKVVPDGTNAPTANYDVYIYESATAATAGDYLGGACLDHSATVTGFCDFIPDIAVRETWQNGTIYPFVSGLTNANDDEGDIVIYIRVDSWW